VVKASGTTVEQQAHLMMGALVGPAGRPSRRRAKNVISEVKSVREREVGMVSDLMEDGRQARKWKRARVQKPFREDGAAASRALKRQVSAVRPLGIGEEGCKAGNLERPVCGGPEGAHGRKGRKGVGVEYRAVTAVVPEAKKAASAGSVGGGLHSEPEAEAPRAEKQGELGEGRVRREVGRGRIH
jgi:hypothetical protein